MIVKTKKVYYCEFCGKRSLKNLIKHEKHCTLNPNRECGLCDRESIIEILEKYKNVYKIQVEYRNELKIFMNQDLKIRDGGIRQTITWLKKINIDNLYEETGHCPNCTFAIIRICNLNIHEAQEIIGKFDYKKELKEYWEDVNKEKIEKERYDV